MQGIICIFEQVKLFKKANIKPYNEKCSHSLKSFNKSTLIEKFGFFPKSLVFQTVEICFQVKCHKEINIFPRAAEWKPELHLVFLKREHIETVICTLIETLLQHQEILILS